MVNLKKIIGIGIFAGSLWAGNALMDASFKEKKIASNYHNEFLNSKDAVEIRDSKLGYDSARRESTYYELAALGSVVIGFYGISKKS